MKILILCRHVSGAGSSTFANYLKVLHEDAKCRCLIASADQYFEENGEYKFDANNLHKAHAACLSSVSNGMYFSVPTIVVTNTFTKESEMAPYITLAEQYDYKVVSMVLENRHGGTNIHNVPEETLKKQAHRLKNSLKLLNEI